VTERLWAPWRLEYVSSADEQDGCVFCSARDGRDEERLVLHRSEHAFAVLNRYPYAFGHLMVAPTRHVGSLGELDDDEALGIHRLATESLDALGSVYRAEAFNLGWNIGRHAGAGIVDHVHLHVVPRWPGDTNFMPLLADLRVIPEALMETRRRLAEAWPGRAADGASVQRAR
jgi:ATP adenylyltransferase